MNSRHSKHRVSVPRGVADPTHVSIHLGTYRKEIVEAARRIGPRSPLAAPAIADILVDTGELHALVSAASVQPIVAHPGRKGAAAYRMKRLLQRGLYWYVEQPWHSQRRLNHVLADHAAASSRVLIELQDEVSALRLRLAELETAEPPVRTVEPGSTA